MGPLQLTDLPWEDIIYCYIFPHLSAADLWRFRGVCKKFEALFCAYMQACEKLDLTTSKMTDEVFQKMTKDCANLQWLSMAQCSWVNDASLMKIFRTNPRLRYVNLSGCSSLSGASLQVLVVNCKKLHTLLLANCPWLTQGGWEVTVFHQSNLRCFNASGCWDVNDQVFQKFFAKFTDLHELHLARVEPVTDETLCFLAHACPALNSLNIAGCWRVTDEGISRVVEYCRNLRVLNVKDCRDVTEQYLCKLFVRGIWVISDYSLAQMVSRRKRVNNLGLNIQI
ncbi:F-box/LRR-repeat protein 15-like [Penaeus indicus]|uniref:F-box/LRR-repeat protein 15-like n=1 Tax=Penaeus indicus TaxID=29960 RepID=UPI00300D6859